MSWSDGVRSWLRQAWTRLPRSTTILNVAREFVWPRLEPLSSSDITRQAAQLAVDKAKIDALTPSLDKEVALEEVRRIADAEMERRKGADQKATTYLVVAAALIPLILTVATALWDKKAGSAPTWINFALLGLAVGYIAWAGLWAFRVLEVAAAARVGVGDVDAAWKTTDPKVELTRRTLWCARANQQGVNAKVTNIKMAHAFLLRAFFAFALLLLFNILWYIGLAISSAVGGPGDPWMASAQTALSAQAEVDRLEDGLRTRPVWSVLDQRCRARTPTRRPTTTVTLVEKVGVHAPEGLRQALRIGAGERLRFRDLEVRCGGEVVGSLRVLDLPDRMRAPVRVAKAEPFGRPLGSAGIGMATSEVTRLWPPADRSALPATLPAVLLRQRALLRRADGVAVGYVEGALRRGTLGTPADAR